MAQLPKMPLEQWLLVRNRWETDERQGFHWVVEEMSLLVSAPAVRKRANKEGWKKRPIKVSDKTIRKVLDAVDKPKRGPTRKRAKPSGSEKPSNEGSETIGVTPESTSGKQLSEFGSFEGLTEKEELFVREFLIDFNIEKACLRAGYSEDYARKHAWGLRGKPRVDAAITALMRDRVHRMGREADELVSFHLAVLSFDMNELVEHRVYACRHCWGDDHAYQHSPSTWQKERDRFKKRWEKMSEEEQKILGDFPAVPPDGWYEAKRGPHAECPECHGDGFSKTIFKDTRHLSPVARLIYAGMKEGREGTELIALQKQKSLETLSSHLGLNKVAEVSVQVAVVTETAGKFDRIMEQARERQRQVLAERGIGTDA